MSKILDRFKKSRSWLYWEQFISISQTFLCYLLTIWFYFFDIVATNTALQKSMLNSKVWSLIFLILSIFLGLSIIYRKHLLIIAEILFTTVFATLFLVVANLDLSKLLAPIFLWFALLGFIKFIRAISSFYSNG